MRTPPVVIDVKGAPPKASGYQRLSEKEQEVVNQYVENLVAADVVEPCSGQWSSPILVPKKDGSLRAVADLRKVNKCVVADSYAMPTKMSSKSNNFSGKRRRSAMTDLLTDWRD